MTLLVKDSFDLYSTGSDVTNRGWSTFPDNPTIETSVVRDGRASVRMSGNYRMKYTFGSAQSVLYLGFSWRFSATPGSDWNIVRWWSVDGVVFYLKLNSSKKFKFINALSSQLGSDSTHSFNTDTWYFVEIRMRFDNSISANDVILWVDGNEEINLASGTDTEFSAGNTITDFEICGGNGTSTEYCYFDSLAAWNTSGSSPWNTYVAPWRFAVLNPNGNGNTNNFVNQGGNSTNNYLSVDDTTSDGDTTYSDSTAVGDIDLYAFSDLPSNIATVLSVNQINIWKKTTTDAKTTRPLVRLNGTNYEGSNVSPTTSYTWSQWLMETSPDTSAAWTKSEIDGAQFGVKDQA